MFPKCPPFFTGFSRVRDIPGAHHLLALPDMHLFFVGIRRVFHAGHRVRFESLTFFDQLLHAF